MEFFKLVFEDFLVEDLTIDTFVGAVFIERGSPWKRIAS